MNFGELKDTLRATFNRSDITDALAGSFVKRAVARLERLPARPPFMERMIEYVSDGSHTITLPADYLKTANVFIDGQELVRVDMAQWQKDYAGYCGSPHVYVPVRNEFWLRPTPEEGTQIYLHYYGTEPELVDRLDTNGWTLSCEDAVLYGALELAADYYEDDRVARFSEKFKECAAEIADQVYEDAMSAAMAVSSPYGGVA